MRLFLLYIKKTCIIEIFFFLRRSEGDWLKNFVERTGSEKNEGTGEKLPLFWVKHLWDLAKRRFAKKITKSQKSAHFFLSTSIFFSPLPFEKPPKTFHSISPQCTIVFCGIKCLFLGFLTYTGRETTLNRCVHSIIIIYQSEVYFGSSLLDLFCWRQSPK